jgi:hypothetical protein
MNRYRKDSSGQVTSSQAWLLAKLMREVWEACPVRGAAMGPEARESAIYSIRNESKASASRRIDSLKLTLEELKVSK